MDRKLILPISLLVLAALILFLPVMVGWKGIFHDTQSTFNFLINYFSAQRFQKGIIPLWDSSVWCGAIPYYAFIYSSHNYYLPSWPFYLLANLNDIDNAYWMLTILPLFMHYVIGAIGMFFLCKKNSLNAIIFHHLLQLLHTFTDPVSFTHMSNKVYSRCYAGYLRCCQNVFSINLLIVISQRKWLKLLQHLRPCLLDNTSKDNQ